MDNSNQSKTNCNNQQTFTVKFIGTQYDRVGEIDTGIWTFTFKESLEEIKNRFQDGYINFVELWNIDELYDECLDDYDYDKSGFYEEYFEYELRSDVWVFDETGKIVGFYTVSTQTKCLTKNDYEYTWVRDDDMWEMNG